MKKIFILVVFSFYNCASVKNEKNENEVDFRLKSFKGSFLVSCLREGFKDSKFDELIEKDNSYAADFPFGVKGYKTIDSLAKDVVLEIKNDSIKSVGKVAEESAGLKVLEKCVCYYESKKLDSIATVFIKKAKF